MSYGMRNVWVSLITFPNQVPTSLQFPSSLILKQGYFNERNEHTIYFLVSFFVLIYLYDLCSCSISQFKRLAFIFFWAQWLFSQFFIPVTLISLSYFFQVIHQNLSEQVCFSVLFHRNVPSLFFALVQLSYDFHSSSTCLIYFPPQACNHPHTQFDFIHHSISFLLFSGTH